MRPTRLNLSRQPVLVVGCSTFEQDVIIQILSGLGAGQLHRAATAEAAQPLVERGDVSFILIDHRNGDKAPFDFARQLRRLTTASRQTPVLMVTAYSNLRIVHAARDSGIDYVVTKPLMPRVLFQRMTWIADFARDFIDSPNYVGPDRRVRALGPPSGMLGRRSGDLPPDVGAATEPNMSQDDVDSFFKPKRTSLV